MNTLHRCDNNGIAAIVSEETYQMMQIQRDVSRKYGQPYADGLPIPRPIFTFGRPKTLEMRPYLTGDYELLDRLTRNHVVVRSDFYVPFSNQTEVNADIDRRMLEMLYCTTSRQLVEAFGLEAVIEAFQTYAPGGQTV